MKRIVAASRPKKRVNVEASIARPRKAYIKPKACLWYKCRAGVYLPPPFVRLRKTVIGGTKQKTQIPPCSNLIFFSAGDKPPPYDETDDTMLAPTVCALMLLGGILCFLAKDSWIAPPVIPRAHKNRRFAYEKTCTFVSKKYVVTAFWREKIRYNCIFEFFLTLELHPLLKFFHWIMEKTSKILEKTSENFGKNFIQK